MGRKGVGQSKTAVAAFGAVPLLLYAAMGAGLGWVGFSTGAREKGLLSILGYVFGVFGGLAAVGGTLGSVLWVAGVSMAPDSEPSSSEPAFPQEPEPFPEPWQSELQDFTSDFSPR
jgi:hypothetical protein